MARQAGLSPKITNNSRRKITKDQKIIGEILGGIQFHPVKAVFYPVSKTRNEKQVGKKIIIACLPGSHPFGNIQAPTLVFSSFFFVHVFLSTGLLMPFKVKSFPFFPFRWLGLNPVSPPGFALMHANDFARPSFIKQTQSSSTLYFYDNAKKVMSRLVILLFKQLRQTPSSSVDSSCTPKSCRTTA